MHRFNVVSVIFVCEGIHVGQHGFQPLLYLYAQRTSLGWDVRSTRRDDKYYIAQMCGTVA